MPMMNNWKNMGREDNSKEKGREDWFSKSYDLVLGRNHGLLKAFYRLSNCEYVKKELLEAFYRLNNLLGEKIGWVCLWLEREKIEEE